MFVLTKPSPIVNKRSSHFVQLQVNNSRSNVSLQRTCNDSAALAVLSRDSLAIVIEPPPVRGRRRGAGQGRQSTKRRVEKPGKEPEHRNLASGAPQVPRRLPEARSSSLSERLSTWK